MKKFILAIVAGLLMHATLTAQTPAQHIVFQNISAVGLLNGSNGSSFMVQNTAGIAIKHSFVGVGAALDLYKYRSVPLYVDLRQNFGKKKNLFLYGDAGFNLPWLTQPQKNGSFLGRPIRGTWYYDAGAGYRIKLNTNALLLSAGYSYKEFKSRGEEYICNLTSCGVTEARYRYHMPRLVIKASLQF